MSRLLRMSVVLMLATMGLLGTAATAAAAPGSQAVTGTSALQEETGTVEVWNYLCDSDIEETWYGSPDDSCVTAAGTFTFYRVGDGSGAVTTQLEVDASGTGTTEPIPVGDYEVYEDVSGASTTMSVAAGAQTLSLLMPSGGGEPVPENADPAGDCTPGSGVFTFYLYGDDSGEPVGQLEVDISGVGSIELPVGTYAVVEEASGSEVDIEVTASGPALLTFLRPSGETPAPEVGTVNVSAFYCDNIDAVEFYSDQPTVAAAELPTEEPACVPGAAVFGFYLYGDDSGDLTGQLELDASGSGSIELPAGSYEVVEEGTGASSEIEVLAGDFTTLTVHIPVGDGTGTGQSVNVSKFYCENVSGTEFLTVGAGEENSEAIDGAPGCVPGSALFSFYLIGDETDDYAQLEVDGTGTLGLLPGSYEVVEEGAQASFKIEVVEGENTILVVNNPMPDDSEAPGPAPEDPGDDDGDETDGVSQLPSTGTGAGGGDSAMLAITAAVASMLAGIGAFVLRREQA